MNPDNFIGENGIKLNVKLDTPQIIMLGAIIFIAMFLAFVLANVLLNSLK